MKGQVWVETVVYTLIGLSLIGLVLGLVTPRINEYRDKVTIEQTISSLNLIDAEISELAQVPGNVRTVNLQLKRGTLIFNQSAEQIRYRLDKSNVLYSQPGQETSIGRIRILTVQGAKTHTVYLSLNYSLDLQFEDAQEIKEFSPASVPYVFSFENRGSFNSTDGRKVVIVKVL